MSDDNETQADAQPENPLATMVKAMPDDQAATIVADAESASEAKGAPQRRAAAEALHSTIESSADRMLIELWGDKLGHLLAKGYNAKALAWLRSLKLPMGGYLTAMVNSMTEDQMVALVESAGSTSDAVAVKAAREEAQATHALFADSGEPELVQLWHAKLTEFLATHGYTATAFGWWNDANTKLS